ncbi:MAG: hypothetical protein AAF705_15420, partial [Bacteroidota bacterium]
MLTIYVNNQSQEEIHVIVAPNYAYAKFSDYFEFRVETAEVFRNCLAKLATVYNNPAYSPESGNSEIRNLPYLAKLAYGSLFPEETCRQPCQQLLTLLKKRTLKLATGTKANACYPNTVHEYVNKYTLEDVKAAKKLDVFIIHANGVRAILDCDKDGTINFTENGVNSPYEKETLGSFSIDAACFDYKHNVYYFFKNGQYWSKKYHNPAVLGPYSIQKDFGGLELDKVDAVCYS